MVRLRFISVKPAGICQQKEDKNDFWINILGNFYYNLCI